MASPFIMVNASSSEVPSEVVLTFVQEEVWVVSTERTDKSSKAL